MPTTRHLVSHTPSSGRKPTSDTSSQPPQDGLFIVFEGLDGAGKTTQIELLSTTLRRQGYTVVSLKEPTDGPWGTKIRQSVLEGRQNIDPEEELAWFLADRRDDVDLNIRPALDQGHIVILDRYYFSTMAYQGALGYDPEDIRQRNEAFAPPPDLLFILDIEPTQGLKRIQQARRLDDFERADYLAQVATIFAKMDFPYLCRISAAAGIESVQARIWQEVRPVLPTHHQ